MGYQENTDNYKPEIIYLRFGKNSHDLDAQTLAITLVETLNTIEQIGHSQMNYFRVSMNVRPFERGSFEIPIELHPLIVGTLFHSKEFLPVIKQSIDILVAYLNLKKILKGKTPSNIKQNGDTISVVASDGATVNVTHQTYNLVQNNAPVNASTERQFQQLEQDETVESFEIMDENRTPLFKSSKAEFPQIKRINPSVQKESLSESRTIELCIQRPVLERKHSSWGFLHDGEKMNAQMKDDDFLSRIEDGEKFAMGDRLQVELETTKIFDASLQVHKVKSRSITKVYRHTPRPAQSELDFTS